MYMLVFCKRRIMGWVCRKYSAYLVKMFAYYNLLQQCDICPKAENFNFCQAMKPYIVVTF